MVLTNVNLVRKANVVFPVVAVSNGLPVELYNLYVPILLCITKAANTLAADLSLFKQLWVAKAFEPYQQNDLLEFVVSARHMVHAFLVIPLEQLASLPGQIRTFQADGLPTNGTEALTINDFLKRAQRSVRSVQFSIGWTINALSDRFSTAAASIPINQASMVPTAVPRECLFRLFWNTQHITRGLTIVESAKLNQGLRNVFVELNAQHVHDEYPNISDGTRKVFFLCAHDIGKQIAFLVGSNSARWHSFPAVGAITAAQRNKRMEPYISIVQAAFNQLQTREYQNHTSAEMKADDLYSARSSAIAAMPKDSQFLGRNGEIGQAFEMTTKLELKQCCYGCQGMMGWQVVRSYNAKERKKYVLQWDWEKRTGFSHSCAEAMVSQQWAAANVQKGRPHNRKVT